VWADRMRRLLTSPEADDMFWYMHEDFFLSEPIRASTMSTLEGLMAEHSLSLIKACGSNAGAVGSPKLSKTDIPGLVRYENSNDYLVSHQVSLWRKDFMASTIYAGYTPWDHEVKGTPALRSRNMPLHAWLGPPPYPYREAFRGNKFRPGGQAMFDEACSEYGIPYTPD